VGWNSWSLRRREMSTSIPIRVTTQATDPFRCCELLQKQLVYYPKRSNLVRPTFRVDDQSPVLPDKHETYRHYSYKHSYSSIDTSHRPFQMLLASAETAGILPGRITKMYGPKASVLTINRPFSDLHVNYQHYHYCYKHSYSSIDTSHRPFQLLLPSAEVAGILPERIHQRCTDQEPSVLTINRVLPVCT
jgi:hypothetical protein